MLLSTVLHKIDYFKKYCQILFKWQQYRFFMQRMHEIRVDSSLLILYVFTKHSCFVQDVWCLQAVVYWDLQVGQTRKGEISEGIHSWKVYFDKTQNSWRQNSLRAYWGTQGQVYFAYFTIRHQNF